MARSHRAAGPRIPFNTTRSPSPEVGSRTSLVFISGICVSTTGFIAWLILDYADSKN